MIIENCSQGSEAWFKLKIGKPSASNASRIITNEGKPSKSRIGYMYELAGEILTGKQEEGYKNANMITGQEREDESRKFFELTNGVEVKQVGVVYKDKKKQFLCSPDGIVNDEYGLELKNVLPKTQVKYLLSGETPEEYFSQIQMSLYITGFEYWMFLSYVPAMRPLQIRVERDGKFLKALAVELGIFTEELEDIINKIK